MLSVSMMLASFTIQAHGDGLIELIEASLEFLKSRVAA